MVLICYLSRLNLEQKVTHNNERLLASKETISHTANRHQEYSAILSEVFIVKLVHRFSSSRLSIRLELEYGGRGRVDNFLFHYF